MSKLALILVVVAVLYGTEANPVPEANNNFKYIPFDGQDGVEKIMVSNFPNFEGIRNMKYGDREDYMAAASEAIERARAAIRGAHGRVLVNDNGKFYATNFRK